MTGLVSVEIAVILSWTFLANSLLGLLSEGSLLPIPICYMLSVAILAWLEYTGSTRRLNCPIQAFGLAIITLEGGRPGQWRIFLRLLLLTPLVLLFGVAFIRVRRKDCKLIHCISGVKLVPLDTSMDPRMPADVTRDSRLAMKRVLGYMLSSVAVTAVILLLPHGGGVASWRQEPYVAGLPEHEAELLAGYLEMAAIYPDSIEFHVRLASLYYRNDMIEDLETELDAIRRIDPDHPMLLLGEDLSLEFADLSIQPDFEFVQEEPAASDSSAEADSLLSPADSTALPDSLLPIVEVTVDPGVSEQPPAITEAADASEPAPEMGTGTQEPTGEETPQAAPTVENPPAEAPAVDQVR
jgi:hypothetical protein